MSALDPGSHTESPFLGYLVGGIAGEEDATVGKRPAMGTPARDKRLLISISSRLCVSKPTLAYGLLGKHQCAQCPSPATRDDALRRERANVGDTGQRQIVRLHDQGRMIGR
jgi:hypothetical protein